MTAETYPYSGVPAETYPGSDMPAETRPRSGMPAAPYPRSGAPASLFLKTPNYYSETQLCSGNTCGRKTFGRRPLAEPLVEPLAVEICFSFRTDTRWSSYSNEPRPQTRSSNPLFPVLNWFLNKTSETDIQSLAGPCARAPGPCSIPARPLSGPCPALVQPLSCLPA